MGWVPALQRSHTDLDIHTELQAPAVGCSEHCFLASSARPTAADDSLAEPAAASAAGAHDAHQQTEDIPGGNCISAKRQAVVPAAARPGPGGTGQTAGRDGPHPGMARQHWAAHLHVPCLLLEFTDACFKNLLTAHISHTHSAQ